MPISQNLRFTASVPEDAEFDHPKGAFLMRQLAIKLSEAGWKTDEMHNWRDCGWSIICRKESADLEITMAEIEPNNWMLQISPRRVPGIFGRVFGSTPSAGTPDTYELSVAVHQSLSAIGFLGKALWCWDGFPEANNATTEPRAASTG